MTTEQAFNAIVARIGNEYGITASANMVCFRDFKVRLARCLTSMEIKASDYVSYLSEDAVEDLVRAIFDTVYGRGIIGYSDRLKQELMSEWFLENMGRDYIRRSKFVYEDQTSRLNDALDDVLAHLNYTLPRRPRVFWHEGEGRSYCSTLANAIIIYDIVCDERTTDDRIREDIRRECDVLREGYQKFEVYI